jgi:hypothetical protein
MNRNGELLPTTYRFQIDTDRVPSSIQEILFGRGFESIQPITAPWFFSLVCYEGNSGKKATGF